MPDDPTEILVSLPVDEVWGVGRRLPVKLRAERILTAQHLRDAPDATIRAVGGVTLLRTAMELRGVPHSHGCDGGTCRLIGKLEILVDRMCANIGDFGR